MSETEITCLPGEMDIINEEVTFVELDGTTHDTDIVVDWKARPDMVMAEVNRVLRKNGVDAEFVELDDGSDQYMFEYKEDEFEDWGSIGPPT